MKVSELKAFLKGQTEKELIQLITELSKLNDVNKDFLNTRINPVSEKELLEKYKKMIEVEYFPKRGFGQARAAVVRKIVGDFKKIASQPENVALLMIYRIVMAFEYTNTYGDIDGPFYGRLCSSYEELLKYLFAHNLQESYEGECNELRLVAQNLAWGVWECYQELFADYYGK